MRAGNFTSSEIVALLSMGSREMTEDERIEHKKFNPKSQKKNIECWPGKAAITYIEEKNYERRLERSLSSERGGRATQWGNHLEQYVFDEKIGTKYTRCSTETIVHPDFDFWCGTPDYVIKKESVVADQKCPFTLNSFCQLVQPLYDGLTGMDAMNAIRENHKEGDTYYWQLVSNAILTGSRYAELIVYVPYQEDLASIRKLSDMDSELYWLTFSADVELPFLNKGGYYKDLNVIRFEVPESDKRLLTDRVNSAGAMLIPRLSVITAHHDNNVGATIIQ